MIMLLSVINDDDHVTITDRDKSCRKSGRNLCTENKTRKERILFSSNFKTCLRLILLCSIVILLIESNSAGILAETIRPNYELSSGQDDSDNQDEGILFSMLDSLADNGLAENNNPNAPISKRSINQTDEKLLQLQCASLSSRTSEVAENEEIDQSLIINDSIISQLSQYYELRDTRPSLRASAQPANLAGGLPETAAQNNKTDLPRPTNVTVLIISWYPPILKLAWKLNLDDDERLNSKLSLYLGANYSRISQSSEARDAATNVSDDDDDEVDDATAEANNLNRTTSEEIPVLRELKAKQQLVEKSLTCFQVIYNIVNSRFKVTEEYPPYLRSITLERLIPATEYSLQVMAIYLNGRFRRHSDRVTFISPTDNESRRFKENTYRPIHRYPDVEQKAIKYGLAQVRSEELTIVAIAIVFWIATICLFFNKWGKIRMLEPYQPAYREIPASGLGAGPPGTGSGTIVDQATGAALSTATSVAVSGATNILKSAVITHHPSLHNLDHQALLAGAQNQVSSLTPAVCCPAFSGQLNGLIDDTGNGKPSVVNKSGLIQGARPRTSEGTLLSVQQKTATGKKHFSKRFDSAAVADEFIPSTVMKRADTLQSASSQSGADFSLNLFQAKAQALAKATSLWSKQQQFRSRMASQSRFPEMELLAGVNQHHHHLQAKLAGSSTSGAPKSSQWRDSMQSFSNLTNSQQTIQAINLQANQQQQQQRQVVAELGESGRRSAQKSLDSCSLSLEKRDPSVAADDKFIDEYDEETSTELVASGHSGRFAKSHPTSLKYKRLILDHSGSKSLDQQRQLSIDQQQVGGQHKQVEPRTSNNKLRRLLFINKTHQHHHIATSISSSTLIQRNDSDPRCSLQDRLGQLQSKVNSSSLDSQYSGGQHRRQLFRTPSPDNGYQARLASANQPQPATESAPITTTATDGASLTSLGGARKSAGSLGVASENDATSREQLVSSIYTMPSQIQRHHILIEPPSPPPANLSSSDIVCQSQDETNDFSEPGSVDHEFRDAGKSIDRRRSASERAPTSHYHDKDRGLSSLDVSADNQAVLADDDGPLQDARRRSSTLTAFNVPAANFSAGSYRQLSHEQQRGLPAHQTVSERSASSDSFAKLANYQQQQRLAAAERELHQQQLRQLAISQEAYHQQHCLYCGQLRHFQCCADQSGQHGQYGALYRQQQHSVSIRTTPAADQKPADGDQPDQEPADANELADGDNSANRPRISSVFVASPYSRAHRDSFAMLRALSQKKSKSAEDVAYLSSLVLQIWIRDRNPLLQSASSQQQLADQRRRRSSQTGQQQHQAEISKHRQRPKSSLTVANLC